MENEKRLIDANNALKEAQKAINEIRGNRIPALKPEDCYKVMRKVLMDAPTVDAVSRGVLDQVRWERDVAIEQLESYGISLGEKADAVKVVRCRDCKKWNEETGFCDEHSQLYEHGMYWDIFAEEDFCSYGERKDNG